MQYDGNIIRPPSEANSIIFQVTSGCSHNKCSFCGAYREKKFKFRLETFEQDLEFASQYCLRQNRVFLADGDALILPYEKLEYILKSIRNKLPWVKKVSLYGNCKAIRSKSDDELIRLKELGLNRVYLGLESGDEHILQTICKSETPSSMVEAAHKVRKSGLFLSVTILLGIAGVELSQQHGRATGKLLSEMAPHQIAALTVIPIPGTPLYSDIEKGLFALPDTDTILRELKTIIEHIDLKRVQFYANHASNYLHLSGRLLKDKDTFLEQLDAALNGSIPLVKDEWRRL